MRMVTQDMGNNISRDVPVFAPYKIVAISAGGTFTKGAGDIAMRNDADTPYSLDGTHFATLYQQSVTGLRQGITYTFTNATNLEIA